VSRSTAACANPGPDSFERQAAIQRLLAQSLCAVSEGKVPKIPKKNCHPFTNEGHAQKGDTPLVLVQQSATVEVRFGALLRRIHPTVETTLFACIHAAFVRVCVAVAKCLGWIPKPLIPVQFRAGVPVQFRIRFSILPMQVRASKSNDLPLNDACWQIVWQILECRIIAIQPLATLQ